MRTGPLDRTQLDCDAVGAQVRDRPGDRAVPNETQVAIPGRDSHARDRLRRRARRVDVQLLLAEAVGAAATWQLAHFGAEDIPVEGV